MNGDFMLSVDNGGMHAYLVRRLHRPERLSALRSIGAKGFGCRQQGLARWLQPMLRMLVLAMSMAGLAWHAVAANPDPAATQEPAAATAAASAAVAAAQLVFNSTAEAPSLEQGIEVLQAGLLQVAGRDDYWINAGLSILLNPTLSDAVNRGVPLYFVLDAELIKPRWYWSDERLALRSRVYRLHYHAITRQYRLQSVTASPQTSGSPPLSLTNPATWLAPLGLGPAATGTGPTPQSTGLYQSFASLQEALQAMGRVRGWPLIENQRLQTGQSYELRLRMRLDANQLPRPLQIPGISQKDWSIESPWKRYPFEIATKKSAP